MMGYSNIKFMCVSPSPGYFTSINLPFFYCQEFDYFTTDQSAKLQNMEGVEKLVEALSLDR